MNLNYWSDKIKKKIRIISWNVNGVRAVDRKGFFEWFKSESPDILCLQEIKALKEQLPPHLKNTPGYHVFFNPAEKRGYSGVATYSKNRPDDVRYGFGIDKFDKEGRILITHFSDFILFNIYFPNGKKNADRLNYKLDFYDTFLGYVDNLKEKNINIIVCGDFNTAHKEIDLSRPKENMTRSGFLPVERAWMDTFTYHGYADTFRHFNKDPENYSWWDMKTRARERNIGWRIDYFFVNEGLLPKVKKAFIMSDIMGSDHCPVGIDIEL